ncbi:hypothetical protein MACH26_10200 [Planctobacterium marinum]|uniref:Metallo-beta-lactamase domain-containing protein n=1 Tax=Planctobacterium marinum TaxID=1631968 RepID=A0AA48HHP5_9ALTE|nr:hypothetical protein MACH26_10200 [Planctobacterium marinum]
MLLDTGATANANKFPLYSEVQKLLLSAASTHRKMPLLVLHSHGHSDHIAADGQFQNPPETTVIPPNLIGVKAHFGYGPKALNWPEDTKLIDLGGRTLTLIPIPGHSEDAIALFDQHTGWLLTGDSLYPGRLYVRNWQEYRLSIQRLYEHTASLAVTAIMGTHIEMSKAPGIDYPVGATYQPNEAPLPLDFEHLKTLNHLLQRNPTPTRIVSEAFILQPLD